MAVRTRTQLPLFTEPCPVCHYARDGDHEPWCPSFMKGAEPGGDPHEWPSLLDCYARADPAAHTYERAVERHRQEIAQACAARRAAPPEEV